MNYNQLEMEAMMKRVQEEAKQKRAKDRQRMKEMMKKKEMEIRKDLMTAMIAQLEDLKKDMEEKATNLMIKFNEDLSKMKITDELDEDEEEAMETCEGNVDERQDQGGERREGKDNDGRSEKNRTNTKNVSWSDQVEEQERRSWMHERKITSRRDRIRFSKIECILTKEIDYTLWRDRINTEIMANDCVFLIDKTVPAPTMNETELEMMRKTVRSFIISNLDANFHRLVKNVQDPQEIMQILDRAGEPTSKHTEFALRKQFVDMKFNPDAETALEFMSRFNDILERIRRCCPVDERSAKANLLMAIEEACPTIHMLEMATKEGLTIDEIQTKLFEEEGRNREIRRRK
uniref:Uncharacterized protein n=1 Tax=Lygus hesperus TaxID=30085 RepID=A0A146LFR3_LYGHE